MKKLFKTTLTLLTSSILISTSSAMVVIDLDLTGMNSHQTAIFEQARDYWQDTLTGYVGDSIVTPSSSNGNALTIEGEITAIDGVGGTLGSAGPTQGQNRSGFLYTTRGTMQFDSADANNLIANGEFLGIVLHEMGHVLGMGTLFTNNNVYVDGSGEYTGAAALAVWQAQVDAAATSVPIELQGGPGTANGHWDENLNGAGLTGNVVDGRDMRDELMTGWSSPNLFMSSLTVASFQDIGYTTVAAPITIPPQVVPEPNSTILFGLGFAGILLRRRK